MTENHYHDVLIVGSGAAGLAAALTLADNLSVAILSKTSIQSGSTWWAQGGIAAVLDDEDSVESHTKDTLIAGAGLCHACLLYTSPSPRDQRGSRMPSSA